MDCLLVNSPDTLTPIPSNSDPKLPLGLLYIASYLRANGFEVRILDYHMDEYDEGEFGLIVSTLRPRVIGLNVSTPNRMVAYHLATAARVASPSSVIVLGGPHVSGSGIRVLDECAAADCAVSGEGELPLLGLVRSAPSIEPCPGLLSRRIGDQIDQSSTEGHDTFGPLDALPSPAYDLIDFPEYLRRNSEAYISSSRGCFFNCSFCSSRSVFGRHVRFRSARSVLDEMQMLHRTYGVGNFYFYDDSLLAWKEFEGFCEEVGGLGFSWTMQGTVNALRARHIPLLRDAGCSQVSFGFESGSRSIQREISKPIHRDHALNMIKLASRHGLRTRGYFMVGFPSERARDMLDTVEFVRELAERGLTDLCVFPVRPYPGTRLFGECLLRFGQEEYERLLDYEYLDDYKGETEPFVRSHLKKYNTIPTASINPVLDTMRLRTLIREIYMVFLGSAEAFERIVQLLGGAGIPSR